MSAALAAWMGRVATAASGFERRWTAGALRRVDPDLAARIRDQVALFDRACITGADEEIERHGAATVRGWGACVRAMEASGEADDAYLLGWDPATGFRVAIGQQRAGADRVAELHGQGVVWVSPDEIAAVLASVESFKAIAAVKRFFPGAEMVDRLPEEPAKADCGLEAVP